MSFLLILRCDKYGRSFVACCDSETKESDRDDACYGIIPR